jgi:hypothetical protein
MFAWRPQDQTGPPKGCLEADITTRYFFISATIA